jgi:hypothetical protein
MRTTLTLDDDVAALIRKIQEKRGLSLKELVNEALRLGLLGFVKRSRRSQPYRLTPVSLGRCKLASLDNIAEVLAHAEGDEHR